MKSALEYSRKNTQGTDPRLMLVNTSAKLNLIGSIYILAVYG